MAVAIAGSPDSVVPEWPCSTSRISRPRQALHVDLDGPLWSPRKVASWYPNAVELTHMLPQQDKEIRQAGRVTLDIVDRRIEHVSRHVVLNLRPAGTDDPYLRAVNTTPFGSPSEVGLRPPHWCQELKRRPPRSHGTVAVAITGCFSLNDPLHLI